MRVQRRWGGLAVVATGLAVQCTAGPTEPLSPGGGLLSTDRNAYQAVAAGAPGKPGRFQLTIVAHLVNPYPNTLYLERCRPESTIPVYVVSTRATSGSAYAVPPACVGSVPLQLAPGATRTDTLTIGPSDPVLGVAEGRFYLAADIRSCPEYSCTLPIEARRSAEFLVQVTR